MAVATTTTTTSQSTADATQLNTLRAELKQWEKEFAEANGGRKAGPHDIKQDPEIAAKYKTYGRLRALEESAGTERKDITKTPSKSDLRHDRTKRKYAALSAEDSHHHTPRKARRELSAPAKNHRVDSDPLHPAVLDPYDSPSVFRRLFSPTTHRQLQQPSPLPLKTAIGPTPQRSGRLLGLFDMLSASGGSTATPSAKRTATLDQEIIQTPSRRSKVQKLSDIPEMADDAGVEKEGNGGGDDDDDDDSTVAMGRTPGSSSKKLYLERLFATPTTLRFATMIEEEEGDDSIEGSQQVQLKIGAVAQEEKQDDQDPLSSGTPSFLRRSNSGRYILNNNNASAHNPLSPIGVRKHRQFNGKGLTALVQGLRDIEKERMEDDWDILKELEAEQKQDAAARTEGQGDIQVGDSQVPHDDNKRGPGGKAWKNKTQKRTTRLVRMKPVVQARNRPSRTTKTAAAATSPPKSSELTQENKGKDESEDELAALDDDAHLPSPRNSRESNRAQGDMQDQSDDSDKTDEDGNYDNIDSDNSSDKDFTTTTTTRESAPKPQQRITSSFTDKIKAAFSSIPIKNNNSTKTATTEPTTKAGKEKGGEKASPKRRKVNPDAHANYRSLKIRSKGQGRFGRGRFGRR